MRSRGVEGSSRSCDRIEDGERQIRKCDLNFGGKRRREERVLERGRGAENEGRRKLSSDGYGGKAREGASVRLNSTYTRLTSYSSPHKPATCGAYTWERAAQLNKTKMIR